MKNRTKYLAKNTALFAMNSIGTKLVNFLLVPIYTAALSTGQYGTVDLVVTLGSILIPVITINIGEAVMRFSLDEGADSNKIMSVGILFSFVSVVAGVLVLLIFKDIDIFSSYAVAISTYFVTNGIYQIFSCYLRGREKLFHFAICNILVTLLIALFDIVFLVLLKLGINGLFYASSFSYIIGIFYASYVGKISMVFKHFNIDNKLLHSMAKYSIVLVPNSLMWWVMNSSDRVMVTAMIGAAANGIYAISYKLPSIISTVSTVFNQAWSYSAIREQDSKDEDEYNNKMFRLLFVISLLTASCLIIIMKPFLKIYVASEYYSAWEYTPYLIIGSFFLTLGTFLATAYTVHKDSKGFLVSGLLGGFTNIILNWLLIPIFKVHGAAFATCISYIVIFIYRYFNTKKYQNISAITPFYCICELLLIGMGCEMFLPTRISYTLMGITLFIEIILCKGELMNIFSKTKHYIISRFH